MNEADREFIHRHNVDNFRRQLAETTDEVRRKLLLTLLSDEEAQHEAENLRQRKAVWAQAEKRAKSSGEGDAPT